MAKLFSKTEIILPGGVSIPAKSVFEASPRQAKQFDALNAARPATAAEVKAAEHAKAVKNAQD